MTAASNIAAPAWLDPMPIVTRRNWQHRQCARRAFVRKHIDDAGEIWTQDSIRGLAAIAKDLKLWQAQVDVGKVAEDLLVLIRREQRERRQADLKNF